ncbi:MAG: reverse transcriptase domain-containing protein [Gloeomargaritales cyanobacterium]
MEKWLVKWKSGDETLEPLSIFRQDDPLAVAEYASRKKIMTMRGFKWCRGYLKERRKTVRKEVKAHTATILRSKRVMRELRTSGKRYQYGVELPRNVKHAMLIDRENNDSKWRDAIRKEMSAMEEMEVFRILPEGEKAPPECTRIPLMMVFAVKPDGTRKSRLVAGGHVTGPPSAEVYASVVQSENVRLIFLLAELNRLELIMGDVSTAYLYAFTIGKMYSLAGPEFGIFEGCVIILIKALYGLKTSGNRWHAHLSDTLRKLGFRPSKIDANF